MTDIHTSAEDSTADMAETRYGIRGDDTLEHVARVSAEFLKLTPPNANRFISDWLSDWQQRGFTAAHTVDQADESEYGGWVWDQLCLLCGQYMKYHTDQQLAEFLVVNLLRVTSNQNVLSSLSMLADRCTDEQAQRLIGEAKAAVETLDNRALSQLLHELARPS